MSKVIQTLKDPSTRSAWKEWCKDRLEKKHRLMESEADTRELFVLQGEAKQLRYILKMIEDLENGNGA